MNETAVTLASWPRRVARNISVATRLSLVILLVALVSLVITSIVGLQRGSSLADTVLEARVSSLGAARADQVEGYVQNLQRSTIGQAISPSTAAAINDFAEAYGEVNDEQPTAADADAVTTLYTEVVAPELSAARGRPVNASGLAPQGAAAVALQAAYVATDRDVGQRTRAGDDSAWAEVHDARHESFAEFVVQSGVDDLYLIEPSVNVIVYSSAKNIDFGTSLLTGPHSGSALAVLIQSFGNNPAAGSVAIHDFTSYAAAGDEPSLFVASPVYRGEVLAGYVAIRIGPDKISSITTNNGSWSAEGETGETYVVARDNLMRSDSRRFIEDRNAYVAAITAAESATEDQIRGMRVFGTTVRFQSLDDSDVDAALDEEPALVETISYSGADVLQARRALEIDGLDWAMISEIETREIEQPIVDFARNLLIAIALFLVAITFIATRWSERLLQTLRIVSTRLRSIRGGNAGEMSSTLLPVGAPTEFVELAADIDTMLETLTKRNADAAERAAERRQLLRRMLPPQAALRAEAGDRDVVEHVAHASIAVIVISGLGPLMRTGATAGARNLLDRFVEETDALARQRGLERIRLTGDSYFAACGTVRPHIDHAARTVSFALDVRDLVRDLGDAYEQISITAGIDSGAVTVGLTGGSDLVYDAWGPTVQRAADLARRADTDTIFVTSAVHTQLPAAFAFEGIDDDLTTGIATVSGRTHDGAPAR